MNELYSELLWLKQVAESSATEWSDATTYEMCETMTGEIDIVMTALRFD